MFVVESRFTIANDLVFEVKEAFRNRPRLIERVPGFIRLDVTSPIEQPEQICLTTFWEDELSFRRWHQSPGFREAHGAIPKGLKLVPEQTRISFSEFITA